MSMRKSGNATSRRSTQGSIDEEFGYHIREARSTARGVLGHEEVDSDTEGEEEQVYEHMKQKGLNTLYLRNDAHAGAK